MAVVEIQGALPAQTAAGADSTTRIGVVPYKFGEPNYDVEKVTLMPNQALTGDATNNATITVQRNRAGTTTTIATLTTTASWVNATPIDIAVAAAFSPPGQALQAGDIVQVLLHQNGTGVAITAGAFVLVELA
jgi:hypothetical protein